MEAIVRVKQTEPDEPALAEGFLFALLNNDKDLLWSVTAPFVRWTLPGESLISGVANGRQAVFNRMMKLKHFEVKFELLHIWSGLEGFALLLHNTARRQSLLLDGYVAIVCQVENGKIAHVATLLSDIDSINEFFAEGDC